MSRTISWFSCGAASAVATKLALAESDVTIVYCEVVQQGRTWNGHMLRNQCHFSYYCDGKPEVIVDQGAYTLALSIAVNWPNLVDITRGATYYHRDDVQPYWTESLSISRKIGRHIFYN